MNLEARIRAFEELGKYLKTDIILNNLIKQATLTNKYNVISTCDKGKTIHKTMLVKTMIDLIILDPILIKIEYCDI